MLIRICHVSIFSHVFRTHEFGIQTPIVFDGARSKNRSPY